MTTQFNTSTECFTGKKGQGNAFEISWFQWPVNRLLHFNNTKRNSSLSFSIHSRVDDYQPLFEKGARALPFWEVENGLAWESDENVLNGQCLQNLMQPLWGCENCKDSYEQKSKFLKITFLTHCRIPPLPASIKSPVNVISPQFYITVDMVNYNSRRVAAFFKKIRNIKKVRPFLM